MSVALLPPQPVVLRPLVIPQISKATFSVMLTRYLLSETIHDGYEAVSNESCHIHILSICLTGVQEVWAHAHVSGLASTSTRRSNATPHPSDITRQQMR